MSDILPTAYIKYYNNGGLGKGMALCENRWPCSKDLRVKGSNHTLLFTAQSTSS